LIVFAWLRIWPIGEVRNFSVLITEIQLFIYLIICFASLCALGTSRFNFMKVILTAAQYFYQYIVTADLTGRVRQSP